MSDLKAILDEAAREAALSVWIPTKGQFYAFKHLTFDQHTRFLTLESDKELNPIEQTFKFTELLDTVIKECHLESISLEDLTIIDRNAIALQLRYLLDDKFRVLIDEKTVDISLKEHISFVNTIGINQFERNSTVSYGNMRLLVDIPSIVHDQRINTEILAFDQDSDDFPAFYLIAETVKFIKHVEIIKNGQPITINMYEPGKITESVQACRMLPLPLIDKVGAYIQRVQVIEEKLMTLHVKDGETERDVPILINTNWFTAV